ncbi:MAG: membrane-bound lytic murein transglycosylase MltF [Gammaproteobacteria bacterium]|nr:membrane-bound lytic murein transglycosylase MltF [Gammaproteobacteria bacterium]
MRHVLIIVLAALLTTCGVQPTLLEEVRALGELRVVTRNSPITYFIGQAGPEGPDYDLVQGFADHLGVRLKLVEAKRFSDVLSDVEAGRAHLAAAGLTVTTGRARRVDFGPPYQQVSQGLVYHQGRKRPRSPADLVGKRLEVVARSSYVETLLAARGQVPALAWTEDPSADAGELLNRVARGEADYTVVDSNLFTIFQRFHPELRVAFNLTEGDAIAWAFQRRGDRSLIDAAAAYLAEVRASGHLAHVMDRYYGHKNSFDYAGTQKFLRDYQQLLPRYRQHFMAAAKRADLDWRLIAAVGYQESHWDPAAISPKGAQGIMMLTPSTASMMGVENPANAAQSIAGGSKYLWRMARRIAKLSPDIPDQDRIWMALAAYNMGYGHLLDARQLTTVRGGNPDRWVDVKDTLPLLMEQRWYTQARWGFARGRETRAYVRNIRNYYDILVWLEDGPEDYQEPGQPGEAPVTADDRENPDRSGFSRNPDSVTATKSRG